MGTTLLTLLNGRTLEVRGSYEETKTALAARQLSADDGRREITLACGERLTIATGMVGMIERAAERTARRTLGFGRVLEVHA